MNPRSVTRLPGWFDAGLVVVAAAAAGVGGVGLLLAVLGHYRLLTTLLVGGVLALVLAALALRRRPVVVAAGVDGEGVDGGVDGEGVDGGDGGAGGDGGVAQLPTVVACLVALASAAYNGLRAGHYVFVDRDPGVYAVTGRWLATHGDLQVPAVAPWRAVTDFTSVGSAGMYPEGDHLEFQFNHLFPVLLAVARGIGGDRAMFAANAVIGALALLVVYAVGVRLCRRPWLVVAAVGALASSLPALLFSRDTYSEPTTLLLLWSGLWLLLTAWERRDLLRAGLGGLLVGATVMARVDALVYLVALPVVAALVYLAAGSRERRRFTAGFVAAAVVGAVPPVVLGSVDLMARATGYYEDLRAQIDPLRWVLVAAVVAGTVLVAVVPRVPGPASWAGRQRGRVGAGLAVAITGVLVVAWAVRPSLQHPTYVVNSTVGALQAQEGLPVAPRLTYAEESMTWFSWYLGPPALVLAVLGLGLVARAAVRGRPAALVLTAAIGPATLLYVYRASNTPEQVWVMRRYLPAVLPLFLLAAVVAVEALVVLLARSPAFPRAAGRVVTAVAAVVLVVFPLGVLGPVRAFETQAGYLPAVETACDRFGPDAAVVFVARDIDAIVLPQTLRSFCDVPVTRLQDVPTPAQLTALVADARAQGRRLWIAGSTQAGVQAAAGSAGTAALVATATNPRKLDTTLTRVPDSYDTETLTLWGAELR